jgi:hypothetical protein
MSFIDEYSSLKKQLADTKSQLATSSTAYAGKTSPTRADAQLDIKSRSLQESMQIAKDKHLKERWFGDVNEKREQEGGETGLMGKALKALAIPLYTSVGVAENLTGKNVTSGFWENIDENIRTGERTYADLLKRSGVQGSVAGPLGFGLDVMMDPVNWATLGTAAIIPRLGVGLAKAGPAGLIKAAESGALQKASVAGKFLGAKNTLAFKELAKKSFESGQEYNRMIGLTIEDIAKNSWSRDFFKGVKEQVLSSNPRLAEFHKYWEYNPQNWHDNVRLQDALIDISGGRANFDKIRAIIAKGGDPMEEYYKLASERISSRTATPNSVSALDDIVDEADAITNAIGGGEQISKLSKAVKEAADAADIALDPKPFVSFDGHENLIRLLEESTGTSVEYEDIRKLINSGMMDETGVQWYDNARQKFKNWKSKSIKIGEKEIALKGEKILEGYDMYLSIFRRVKVPGSPTAYTNAILGNPVMAAMTGIDVFSREYISGVKKGWQATGGSRNSDIALQELLSKPVLRQYFMRRPTETRGMLGMSPQEMGIKIAADGATRIGRIGRQTDLINRNWSDEDVAKALSGEIEIILRQIHPDAVEISGRAESLVDFVSQGQLAGDKARKYVMGSPNDLARDLAVSGGGATKFDTPVGMIPQEFFDSNMANRFFDAVAMRAEAGQPVAKLLDLFLNKAPDQYGRIDQAYRFGLLHYATSHGLSEKEVRLVGRYIDIGADDLGKVKNVDGIARYELSPEKAMELASAAYLNYAAMPAAIKVLRSMPLLGSPFASFMYGMSLKTLQAVPYNPAVFNKITFALNDFGGTEGPVDKASLQSPYYSRLNDYAMYRLPFFQEHPLYLNLANILPFYSLNMFQPTDRNYGDTIPDSLVYLKDKLPIANDPAAQVIFDYLILPMILSEGVAATGTFGQRIYPEGAGALEKTLLAGRAAAETVLPGALGVTGLVAPDVDIPFTNTSAIEALPLYRARSIGYAKEGKNVYGVTGREPASSRTIRSLGALAGLSVSPMDTTYTEKEFKEEIKK